VTIEWPDSPSGSVIDNENFDSPFLVGEGISMSGKIVEFRIHHDLKRARLYREQAVPRGPAIQARLDRISNLLEELEDLTRGAKDLPAPLLVQARASIEKTSRIVKPGAQFAVSAGPEENDEGDPQPDVDREILERMYRDLNPHT
jgi:hypothetical protein